MALCRHSYPRFIFGTRSHRINRKAQCPQKQVRISNALRRYTGFTRLNSITRAQHANLCTLWKRLVWLLFASFERKPQNGNRHNESSFYKGIILLIAFNKTSSSFGEYRNSNYANYGMYSQCVHNILGVASCFKFPHYTGIKPT